MLSTMAPISSGCCRTGQISDTPTLRKNSPSSQALERLDLRFDLVAVFGIGEQQSGEESAERHLDMRQLHQPRRAEHHEQGRGREHFGDLRAGDDAQHRSQQMASAHSNCSNHADYLDRRQRLVGRRRRARVRAEQRNQSQDRNRGQI